MSNARLTNVMFPFPVIKSERFPVKINICVSYFMIYTCTICFHTAYQKKKHQGKDFDRFALFSF